MSDSHVLLGLTSVIVAVKDFEPRVLVIGTKTPGLPFGAFSPESHRTLELALRSWVDEQTGMTLGYVEQLYTFGNRHRSVRDNEIPSRIITVGYLALVEQNSQARDGEWASWYRFLPWEDHRQGRPALLETIIIPGLQDWASQAQGAVRDERFERIALAFGNDQIVWDPERVIWRYELLYEAGLVEESHRDWQAYSASEKEKIPITQNNMQDPILAILACKLGSSMDQDHRRILASSVGRLRGKLKYRPVVFELVPPRIYPVSCAKGS